MIEKVLGLRVAISALAALDHEHLGHRLRGTLDRIRSVRGALLRKRHGKLAGAQPQSIDFSSFPVQLSPGKNTAGSASKVSVGGQL